MMSRWITNCLGECEIQNVHLTYVWPPTRLRDVTTRGATSKVNKALFNSNITSGLEIQIGIFDTDAPGVSKRRS
jgi:hypothetical protein